MYCIAAIVANWPYQLTSRYVPLIQNLNSPRQYVNHTFYGERISNFIYRENSGEGENTP
ncbi:hypothetical protein U3516DRAFT_756572 [Neocallimastix sp. 'constans']